MASTSAVKLEHVPSSSPATGLDNASGSVAAFTDGLKGNAFAAKMEEVDYEGGPSSNSAGASQSAPSGAGNKAIENEDAHLLTLLAAEEARASTKAAHMRANGDPAPANGASPAPLPKPGTPPATSAGAQLTADATMTDATPAIPAFPQQQSLQQMQSMAGPSGTNLGAGGAQESGPIQAYAKLEFPGFSYYIQTLDVLIGRRPGNAPAPEQTEAQLHITGQRPDGQGVDVDLGPLKSISRHHARIFYNPPGVPLPGESLAIRQHTPAPTEGTFVLEVLGRNGAFVDDVYLDRGVCVPLAKR